MAIQSLLCLLLSVCCLLPDPLEAQEQPPKGRPNIIIIFTDDQGYQDVGVFGSPDIRTPHLDRMAAEGVKFTNFHVAQAVCSASRAALLTGSYPNRVGIHGALNHTAKHGLNPDETTIAEVVSALGYRTAAIGKWHLGHHPPFLPTRQGFDEFFGLPYSNDMWPHHPENKNYYPPLPLYENETVIDTVEDQRMLTTWYTERAVDFIERNHENPFFLYLAHSMPHVPLFVSDKFKGKSERGLYGDVIMEIDWSVGEILGALQQYGLDDRTLVIFTSDNGPWLSYSGHSGEALPLREGKGTSWEGGIRVPCIMRWPGQLPAGKTQTEPAMTIDLLPTIAGLTGGKLPKHPIDGLDIWPLIRMAEGATSPHEAFYIYYNRNELQAILMDDWKLYLPHAYRTIKAGQSYRDDGIPIKYEMIKIETPELYHLGQDVSETTNVAANHPEVVTKMLGLAQKARQDLGDALTGVSGRNVRQPGRLDTETDYFRDVTATHVPHDPEAHILEVAFADVDGDGDLDVVAALEADENRLYLNDGNGKLTWKKDVFKAVKHDSEHVRAVDFDSDGHLDVVFVAEDDQTHEYYLGNGDGSFRDVSDRLLAMSEGNGLDVGDVDGDGLPDIVVGNSGTAGQNFLWINDPARPGFFIDRTLESLPQINDATQSIKLADLNGDGHLDMVVGNEVPPNRLLLNDGKGLFTEHPEYLELPELLETREALVFDVDSDGDPDIVFANITSNAGVWDKNPQARVLINDGQACFTDETSQRMPAYEFSTYSAREVDFDHDGHLDLLLSAVAVPGFEEERLRAYRNDGNGYFTDVTEEVLPQSVVGRNWNITIGDLNGDGIGDAFIGGWASQGRLLLGKVHTR